MHSDAPVMTRLMCRCLAVHPTQPYILSSSDDMLIKLWDWEKVRPCDGPVIEPDLGRVDGI